MALKSAKTFFFDDNSVFSKPDNFLLSICSESDVFGGSCHRHERQKEFSQSVTYFINE